MVPITLLLRLFAYKEIRLLLLMMLACTIVSACSGGDGSSGGDSQSDLPNPYANGFRVVQRIRTLAGEPWSIENYVYNQEKNTIVLNETKSNETISDIQILNSSGLIVRSGKPDENGSVSENFTIWDYTYNEKGQLVSQINLGGLSIGRYIRDAEGNITKKSGSSSFDTIEYTYGVNGELESVLDALHSELFVIEYNAAGQLSGGISSFDSGDVRGRLEVLYDENGNVSRVTEYVGIDESVFSDRYVYEETDEVIVNHSIMRLLNELPDIILTSF